jgi:hypothetical protein
LTTLSMEPAKRGVSVRIATDSAGSRAAERDIKRRIDAIRVWLTAIRLVVEGRIPWPAAEMPANVHKQCLALPTLEDPQTASADVLIDAPVDVVWEVVWAPQTSCLLGSEPPVYADTVPGTPARAVGEMQYSIYQRDESFLGMCHAVTEISIGRTAMVQAISPPHEQMYHVLSPEGSGCRFTLTARYGGEALDEAAYNAGAARLQAMAGEYKTLIERAGARS